ncbi:unnamed protein product [Toxocara canis]|uniref:GLOBIN domain-containing protein n=1 Tax=Toxocara canis TaxID=6265 RepID=A0A183UVU5_TOXCA|nr:unnamed protein product [Toxocara canis]
MMRIKEAIQRRRLIQEMNDDWNAYEEELADEPSTFGTLYPKTSFAGNRSQPTAQCEEDQGSTNSINAELALQRFAQTLNARMNTLQKRALRITWKRLSEAPRTSGRGTINIMEKVFEKMVERCSDMMPIFYRSAFLSCVEDKKRSRKSFHPQRTIATIRDHAHLLADFIGDILCAMFDTPLQRSPLDPQSIARTHLRLEPLGFQRQLWDLFGETLAEVMFSQECVRAYPHAASAWSMLSVALSDSFHAASKKSKISSASMPDNNGNASASSSTQRIGDYRVNNECCLDTEAASCSVGITLANMPHVASTAHATGSCVSAVASLTTRRRSIPPERVHSSSAPARISNYRHNRSLKHTSQSERHNDDMCQPMPTCPLDNNARVTTV